MGKNAIGPMLTLVFRIIQSNAANDDGPVINTDMIMFYNKFMDPVGYIRTDGYIGITCDLGTLGKTCDCQNVHLIDPNNHTLMSTVCYRRVKFMMQVKENSTFGEYRCRYLNYTSKNTFNFTYRLCSDTEESCKTIHQSCANGHPKCDHKYCVITAIGTFPCVCPHDEPLKSAQCAKTDVNPCPSHKLMNRSCEYDGHAFDAMSNMPCDEFEVKPRISINRDAMTFLGQKQMAFLYPPKHPADHGHIPSMLIDGPYCQSCAFGVKIECSIMNDQGEIMESKEFRYSVKPTGRDWEYPLNHSIFGLSGFEILKFQCIFYNVSNDTTTDTHMAMMANYLIKPVRAIILANYSKDKRHVNLSCSLDQQPSAPFSVSYSWFKHPTDKTRPSKLSENSIVHIVIDQNDTYKCTYEITFKSCSPYMAVKETLQCRFLSGRPI